MLVLYRSSYLAPACFLALGGLHQDKLCDTLQAMAPTYVKAVHRTSLLFIESNFDRLGLLSSTHGQHFYVEAGTVVAVNPLYHQEDNNNGVESCWGSEGSR